MDIPDLCDGYCCMSESACTGRFYAKPKLAVF